MELFWAVLLVIVSFAVLAKAADWLVDGAAGISVKLGVPKVVVGIVLVSLATTIPEFTVSVTSALSGLPEISLGNAIGSVIFDDGVPLALVGILATAPVLVSRKVVGTAAIALVSLDIMAFVMMLDGTLSRTDGTILLIGFFTYIGYIVWDRLKHPPVAGAPGPDEELSEHIAGKTLPVLFGLFFLGVVLVLIASRLLVDNAVVIARALHISEVVIGLTLVAAGTSIPEVATAVSATRKGHGALSVGNILGADILNISWIAGASAVANPLTVSMKVVYFMFPSMLAIVFTMLIGLLWKKSMTRGLGLVLMGLFAVYMAVMMVLFPPQIG